MRHLLTILLIFCIVTLWYFNKEQERIIKRQNELIKVLESEMCKQDSLHTSIVARKDSLNNALYNQFYKILTQQSNGNKD